MYLIFQGVILKYWGHGCLFIVCIVLNNIFSLFLDKHLMFCTLGDGESLMKVICCCEEGAAEVSKAAQAKAGSTQRSFMGVQMFSPK